MTSCVGKCPTHMAVSSDDHNLVGLQVNGNLQAQVSALQGDNISFQRRVSSLQDTTSSLSTQISALAQQAQAASSVGNQVQVSCLSLCLCCY